MSAFVQPSFAPIKMVNLNHILIRHVAFCFLPIFFFSRLRFLGKVLSVERAGKALSDNKNKQSEGHSTQDSTIAPASLLKGAPITSNIAKGNIPGSEPIAARLGVDYQFPPHLEYAIFSLNLRVL